MGPANAFRYTWVLESNCSWCAVHDAGFHLILPHIEDNEVMNAHHWCDSCHKHIVSRGSYAAPMSGQGVGVRNVILPS